MWMWDICGDVGCWFDKCHHLLLSGADPGRICEFSKFQCEQMLATWLADREKF